MASNPEKKADDRRFEEHRDQDPSSIADLLPDGMSGDIIVSKFSGWGSLVTIIPLLDAIKNRFPESGIILLTHRKNEEFAKILPQITRTILFSNPGLGHFLKSPLQFWKKIRNLRKGKPTVFIDLQIHTHQSLSMILSLASGASIRVGLKSKPSRSRDRFLTHSIYFNRHQPLSTVFRQIGNLLGLGPLAQSPKIPILFSFREQERVLEKLNLPDPQKRLLVINPNASKLSHERRWPRAHFIRLLELFFQRFPDTNVVFTGSPGEYQYNEPILKAFSGSRHFIRNVAGRLTLQETAILLKKASLFLTNDSGPLHLALALGTPTVAMFGPTHPDLVLYRPNPPKSIFLYEPIYCSPCLHQTPTPPCAGDNKCIQAISPESVLFAMESLLTSPKKDPGPQEWRFNPARYSPQNERHTPGLIQDSPVKIKTL